MVDKDWASKHLQDEKPLFRERAPEPKQKPPVGKIIAAILVLGLIGTGVVTYKTGVLPKWLDANLGTMMAPVESSGVPSQDVVDSEPLEVLAPSVKVPKPVIPVEIAAPEPTEAPALPAEPKMSQAQIASIQRGIDTIERQKSEHQTLADNYEAQSVEAQRKKYPPGTTKQNFEQYSADLIRAARAKKDTSTAVNLEAQVGTYRAKLAELAKKRAHELEVIESLEKRQAVEREKLQ